MKTLNENLDSVQGCTNKCYYKYAPVKQQWNENVLSSAAQTYTAINLLLSSSNEMIMNYLASSKTERSVEWNQAKYFTVCVESNPGPYLYVSSL